MAQVTVVSKGMRWSPEASQKALQNHQYIKIGPKQGFLLLSGAPGRWKKPETAGDVYVPSLRVAGNPAVIRQVFIGLNYSANDIAQHLALAYTSGNYATTMKANFDAEVAAYKAFKGQKDATKAATGGPDVTLDDLQYFVEELGKATTVARTTAVSPRGATSPRAGRVQPLLKRLADARSKGKVLDVSKMDRVKGTGIKMIVRPGPNSKKIGAVGLDIVSSDPGLFAIAVRQLGAQYEHYIAQYNAALVQKNAIAAPTFAAAPVLPAPTLSPTYMAPPGSPYVPTLPAVGATSPFAGGVALPTVPGAFTLPAGSPPGSPFQ